MEQNLRPARRGVRCVFLRHLSKSYLDGALFYLDTEPCVALTLRYDYRASPYRDPARAACALTAARSDRPGSRTPCELGRRG